MKTGRAAGEMALMRFTIVTPSLNQLEFLRRNVASVRDQEGVEVEHVIQDAGSTDGTAAWLEGRRDLTCCVEPDEGMYDAINRGILRGSGEVVAWLNCDEQYLPGALLHVSDYFKTHPDIDIIFGHTVIVDTEGRYLCHRKAALPELNILRLAILPVHSSSMFFRRRIVEDGMLFDTQWKALGDWNWVLRAKRKGVRMNVLNRFLSTHTDTGANLILTPGALSEIRKAKAMAPAYLKMLRPLLRGANYGKKILSGYYRQEPFRYDIFPPGENGKRKLFQVDHPTVYWKSRMFSS